MQVAEEASQAEVDARVEECSSDAAVLLMRPPMPVVWALRQPSRPRPGVNVTSSSNTGAQYQRMDPILGRERARLQDAC
jgi:hypothetical protein